MKKLLTGLAAAGLVATTMTGCGSKADITIAVWGEYLGLDAENDWDNSQANFIEKIKEETGYSVKVISMNSNEELKNLTDANHIDIVFPSEYYAHKMAVEGQLAEIDYSKLSSIDEDDFHTVIKENFNTYEKGALTDYAIPYAMGDLRIISDNTTIKNLAVDGEISIEDLIDSGLNIGIHDDPRNVALIAELYTGTTDSELANNPTIASAKTNMEALFTDTNKANITIADDVTLAETYASSTGADQLHAIIGYNADPLWMYYDNDDRMEATDNFQPAGANNLWVDTVAITKDANIEKAHQVIDLMYAMYDELDVVYNGYTPILQDVYDDEATGWEGNDKKAFELSSTQNYSMFQYAPHNNKDYNDEIDSAYIGARA